MERMTKYDTDGQAVMDCEKCKADWTGKHGKPMVDCTALYCRNRLKARLAAYEDSMLTPERYAEFARADAEGRYIVMRDAEQEGVARLRELAEADKDGRVVVQPCKVGDKLYRVFYGKISELRVGFMQYFAIQGRWDIDTTPFCSDVESSIGKTIFLTREEAEKALEGKRNG